MREGSTMHTGYSMAKLQLKDIEYDNGIHYIIL